MVGGAPVTSKYAETIGADGYSETAAASVDLARRLVGLVDPDDNSVMVMGDFRLGEALRGRRAGSGKGGMNRFANRLASVVAGYTNDLLPDPVSPLVASDSFHYAYAYWFGC